MDIPKGTPIKVTWLDAEMESGWCQHSEQDDQEDLPDSAYLVSVGLFVSEGPKFLTLSFSYNEEAEDWLGKHRIPIGMIKNISELQDA
jgi:hypothetical protein